MKRSVTISRYATIPSPEDLLLLGLEYLWALLVVLNGNSVYHASVVRNYYLLELCVVLTVVLLGVNFVLGRIKIGKRNLMLAVLLCLYAVVYFAVRQNTLSSKYFVWLFIAGLPVLFLLFAEYHRLDRLMPLMNRLVNVVVILCTSSLIFWILGPVLDLMTPNMSIRISWGGVKTVNGLWGIFFQIQRDATFGVKIYRNSGIFTEAPMLNLWANLALAMTLLLNKKPSMLKTVVLIATIVTTFSTTGLIFIVLCFGLKYYDRFRKMGRLAKALLLAAAVAAVPAALYFVYEILATKSETVSYAMRMSDYIGGLKLWMDYPIFGSGFGVLSPLMKYVFTPTGEIGFSNSVMAVLGTGGLWVAAMYYIPHIAVVFPSISRSKAFSFYSICFLYLFVTTIFFARYLAVVMIALDLAILLEPQHNMEIA